MVLDLLDKHDPSDLYRIGQSNARWPDTSRRFNEVTFSRFNPVPLNSQRSLSTDYTARDPFLSTKRPKRSAATVCGLVCCKMYKIAWNPIGSAIKYTDEIEAEMESDQSPG